MDVNKMKKQDMLYNIPAATFLLNATLFSLDLLFDGNIINYLFSFSTITLLITIGSIFFMLGLFAATKYFVPVVEQRVKEEVEYKAINLDNHDFSILSSLDNFEFSLNLIEDIDDYIDTMSPSQLMMLSEKLKQVFIQIEAIELQEIRSDNEPEDEPEDELEDGPEDIISEDESEDELEDEPEDIISEDELEDEPEDIISEDEKEGNDND